MNPKIELLLARLRYVVDHLSARSDGVSILECRDCLPTVMPDVRRYRRLAGIDGFFMEGTLYGERNPYSWRTREGHHLLAEPWDPADWGTTDVSNHVWTGFLAVVRSSRLECGYVV